MVVDVCVEFVLECDLKEVSLVQRPVTERATAAQDTALASTVAADGRISVWTANFAFLLGQEREDAAARPVHET